MFLVDSKKNLKSNVLSIVSIFGAGKGNVIDLPSSFRKLASRKSLFINKNLCLDMRSCTVQLLILTQIVENQ